jgi:predicted transcriptional regulator
MSRLRLCRLAIAAEAARIGGTALGPLEARVLEAVWGCGRALTVREVQGRFPDLAYTTLMTTLDRLYRKRLLLRSRRGRAFAYEGRRSPEEALHELLSGQMRELLQESGASTPVLSALVSAVSRQDGALLDELDALVQAEYARLKGPAR